ncbi:hypothetical protein MtrunA17_Chr5g0426681 [Medicago truncatula]|uniref:Transmembrane protein n=1 Tax=Medicago truncatula TaxID=3880 RepID=A0A396HUG2_MEDTR|nr:hypothetical protein MtrunA17_Chr5g0426681 [Medicago truncatula]
MLLYPSLPHVFFFCLLAVPPVLLAGCTPCLLAAPPLIHVDILMFFACLITFLCLST